MQIECINVPCVSLSLSPGFLIACLPKIRTCCVTMIASSSRQSSEKEGRGGGCESPDISRDQLWLTAEVSYETAVCSCWILPFLFQPFHPMVNLECSRDFRPFLCALYAPVCMEYGRVTLPCRRLCQRAYSECSKLMEMFGVSWPEDMECTRWANLFSSESHDKILVWSRLFYVVKQTFKMCSITRGLIFPSICVTACFLGWKLSSYFYHLPKREAENFCGQLL